MTVSSFEELIQHIGHKIVIATYGKPPVNAAIECETCNEVLLDFDRNPDIIPHQQCKACGTEFEWEPELARCPECNSKQIELISRPLGGRNEK